MVDVAAKAATKSAGIALGPLDLLCVIVKTLGCMRGRESRYLPSLLSHSEFFLGLDSLTSHQSLSISLSSNGQAINQLAIELDTEEQQADEQQVELGSNDEFPLLWESAESQLGSLQLEPEEDFIVNTCNWLH